MNSTYIACDSCLSCTVCWILNVSVFGCSVYYQSLVTDMLSDVGVIVSYHISIVFKSLLFITWSGCLIKFHQNQYYLIF
jgi:hypothetical protein